MAIRDEESTALRALVRSVGDVDRHARDVLADLLAARLGTDPDAFVLTWRMLPDFTGPVDELLSTAATAAGRPA